MGVVTPFIPKPYKKRMPGTLHSKPSLDESPDLVSITHVAPRMVPPKITTTNQIGGSTTTKKRPVKQGLFDTLLFRAEEKSLQNAVCPPVGPKERRDERRANGLRAFELAVVTGDMKVRLDFDVPIQRPLVADKKRKKFEVKDGLKRLRTSGMREADQRVLRDSAGPYRNRAAMELANIRAGIDEGRTETEKVPIIVIDDDEASTRENMEGNNDRMVSAETPTRRVLRSDTERMSNEKIRNNSAPTRRVLRSNSGTLNEMGIK